VFQSEVEDLLDKYKQVVDRRVCAEVDAGCCQTRRDYEKRDRMCDEEYSVRDEIEKSLLGLIEKALDLYKVGIITANPKKTETAQ
jgi:hypothetical protein